MAITVAGTPNVLVAGAVPSEPVRHRSVRMSFAAGDTYPNPGGYNITTLLAALYPGETVVEGHAVVVDAAGTIRIFEVVPGTTVNVLVFEWNAGTPRQVPNGANLSAHSPVDLSIVTK